MKSAKVMKELKENRVKSLDNAWESSLQEDLKVIGYKIEETIKNDPLTKTLMFTKFVGEKIFGPSGYDYNRYVDDLRQRIRAYGYEVPDKGPYPKDFIKILLSSSLK